MWCNLERRPKCRNVHERSVRGDYSKYRCDMAYTLVMSPMANEAILCILVPKPIGSHAQAVSFSVIAVALFIFSPRVVAILAPHRHHSASQSVVWLLVYTSLWLDSTAKETLCISTSPFIRLIDFCTCFPYFLKVRAQL